MPLDPDPLTVWPDDPARQSRRLSGRIAALCVLAALAIFAAAYLGGIR